MSAPMKHITFALREQAEADRKPLRFGIVRRLFSLLDAYPAHRTALAALVVIRAILLPLASWTIGAVIGGPVSRLDLRGIVLGTLGFIALIAATQYLFAYRMYFGLTLGEKVIHDLRRDMFAHLQKMTMRYFHTHKIGRTISRFTTDTEAVRVGVQDVLFVGIVQGGQMIVAALFMLWYDRVLFMLVLGMAPLLWGINTMFHRRLSKAYRDTQESFSRVTATLAESVKGIRVTQGFSREEINAGIFRDLVTDHSRYNIASAKAAGMFLPLLDINAQLFIALILLAGGWRVMAGAADMHDLYQFILMSTVFFGPLQALGAQYNNALSAMAGAERVFAFLDRKPDWTDPPRARASGRIEGRVELKNVRFEYEQDCPVVHDISFAVDAGSNIALAGQTGCGKSTIINLIAKFYLPTEGSVLLDGTDIRDIDSTFLHRNMGIVLQQNFLFTGTIFDNIRMGRPGAPLDEVVEAARKLDCLEVLESLPEGFMTTVGEGGVGISLGQRQLVCFTRAMLADPRILILDEATSSVDTLTEERVQKALSLLLAGRTSIVVAHRLSTIRNVNRVLVLESGRIAEQGTHRSLLRRRGLYAQMYKRFIS
jgi:ATP-binding cassette subfamily B protein